MTDTIESHADGRRATWSVAYIRRLRPFVPPVLIALAIVVVYGPWYLNTMDGGLILAESYRVLHGQVPHLDFITPRPAGSAYLHLIDFAIPLPLEMASRAVAAAEFVAYTFAFGLLLRRRSLQELSLFDICAVAAATLVNLHAFLLIPFYTPDGLLLCGVAFVLLERGIGRDRRVLLAWAGLLLGTACIVKQSFWPAPVAASVYLVGRDLIERRGIDVRRYLTWIAALALVPALYVVWVAANGGFHDMTSQMFGTTAVYGDQMLNPLRDPRANAELLLEMLIGVVLTAEIAIFGAGATRGYAAVANLLPRLGLSALTLWVIVHYGLAFNGGWALMLFWIAASVSAADMVARRRLDPPALAVLLAAYMTSLSWGAPTPGLTGGLLALLIVTVAWRGYILPRTGLIKLATAALAVGALLAVANASADARRPIGFRAADEVPLGSIHPSFWGISAIPEVATYLRDATACIKSHPAKNVAVLPEGALLYPTLGLHNPFPIDWFWLPDYSPNRDRLVASARALGQRGHYLVLFQNHPIGLASRAVPGQLGLFYSDSELTQLIRQPLHGRRVSCGSSFIGFYSP